MNPQQALPRVLDVFQDIQSHRRCGRRHRISQGFVCKQCQNPVTTHTLFSKVQNRNHCPYCLWSRHVDLHTAGDRLAACKALMQPVGLTLKRSFNKYGSDSTGELMLIHLCTECGRVSINRLAADDDPEMVEEVYEKSLAAGWQLTGILLLGASERTVVQTRLYGR